MKSVKQKLINEFGVFAFMELEDVAAWEDAVDVGYAQAHPLWNLHNDENYSLAQLKICRDYRLIAGY